MPRDDSPAARRAAGRSGERARRGAVVGRRRRALCTMAVAALVAGAAIGAAHGGRGAPGAGRSAMDRTGAAGVSASSGFESARRSVARMPLRRQVGTLLMISFSGTAAPSYVLDALRAGRAGGVVLFGNNVASPGQVRRLTASLRRAGGRDALVALDQEGGSNRTLPFAYPVLSQAAQSTAAVAAAQARRAAGELRRAGVTVTLGPVADVASGPASVMRSRAFPGGVRNVAASVMAATRAYRRGGVLPALKHYPGLGGATANTDRGPVDVELSRAALRAQAAPFRAAAAGHGPALVMLSHARYPALDPSHIASQSPTIVARLKRVDAPGAVVMSDSMEARAVTARSTVGRAAVRSVGAGADLLLLTGPGSFLPVTRALVAAAGRSPALLARVRDAAARVLALRRWTRGVGRVASG